jgi:hypothetical protein
MTTMELNQQVIVAQVCALRKQWDRQGVNSFIEKALTKYPIELVHRVAIEAAKDNSASSPAVIPWRCQEAQRKQGHRAAIAANSTPRPLNHCGYSLCECEHRECDRGWVEYTDPVYVDPVPAPCPGCKPRLVEILAMPDLSSAERHALISTRTTP